MTGIPCENNHKHGESAALIAYANKYLCQACINEIGDFDEFGPLNVPNKKRDAALAAREQKRTFLPPPTKIPTKRESRTFLPPKVETVPMPMSLQTSVLPSEKKCSICSQMLPLADFENDKRRPDGHGPRCKPCVKKRASERKAEVTA